MTADKTRSSVWQLSCVTTSCSPGTMDVLKEVLISMGLNPEDLIEYTRGMMSRLSIYLPSASEGRRFKSRLQSLRLKGITVTLKVLKAADWQERWKRNIKPFALTKTFDVVPVWASPGYQRKRKIPVYLDTILSFGTGLHETTRFMAGLIEERRGQFETFLDVGTGTGLLAVVAHHCGARAVDAVDIDPMSIQTAKKNLEANGFRCRKMAAVDFASWKTTTRYDFVAANLVTHDLVMFGSKLIARVNPGRLLAISGVSLKNLPKIKKFFRKQPLRLLKTASGKEWAALLYQREGE